MSSLPSSQSVLAVVRGGLFLAENDADAGTSFAGVEGMTRTDSYGLG